MLLHLVPVLGVEPAAVDRRAEARGVDGKLRLDALEGCCALFDEGGEERRKVGAAHEVEQRVVAGRLRHVAGFRARFDVRGRTAARDGRVDLHHHAVDGIGKRDGLGAAPGVRGILDPVAERAEERLDLALLGALRRVVGRPVLRVGLARELDGLGRDGGARLVRFDGLGKLDGPEVLALHSTRLMVGTRARLGERVDHVTARVAVLRGDEPRHTLDLANPPIPRQKQPALLSCIHVRRPRVSSVSTLARQSRAG